MSRISMTRTSVVMSPWMKDGDVLRAVMHALETRWTGSGVMRNRRLRCLEARRWTFCAEMMREARCVDVFDGPRAVVDLL